MIFLVKKSLFTTLKMKTIEEKIKSIEDMDLFVCTIHLT